MLKFGFKSKILQNREMIEWPLILTAFLPAGRHIYIVVVLYMLDFSVAFVMLR